MAAAEEYPDEEANESLAALATAAEADGPHYRPEQVAYDAIWPAAEDLWGENWLDGAYPGTPLQFPRWDVINGQRVEVCLIAQCEQLPLTDDSEDGPEPQSFHKVTLNYTPTVTGFHRDYIFASAREGVEGNPASPILSYPANELRTKTCDSYTFESDGEVHIIKARLITVRSSGEIVWNSEDAQAANIGVEPDFRRLRLYDDDLQTIGKALMILTGLTAPMEAIDEIKGHPIEDC
jgi:hypothetical protein